MAGFRIEGNTSGNVAEVNANNELRVTLAQTEVSSGYATITSEVDGGSVTGTRLMRDLEVSNDYRLRVGQDMLIFSDNFPGSILNQNIWTAPATVATVTVASGFLTLNAGLSTASGSIARVSTYRGMPLYGTMVTYAECLAQFAQPPVANNVTEWGFGLVSGAQPIADGAFFRFNSAGEFRAIISNNGSEIQSSTLDFTTLIGANTTKHFAIGIADDEVIFWINDIIVAQIDRPTAGATLTTVQSLPMFFRTNNTNATGAAQVMKIGGVFCTVSDNGVAAKAWPHILAGMGQMGAQGQTGFANVGSSGSTALYTNSLAAGAGAAATNTAASLGSGLGGQFALQPTLAVPTDGIISSYQVPTASATWPGKSLYVTGVKIHGVVTTALVGGPVFGPWSLAFGHTAVSLATGDTATAKGPRRIPLGVQYFTASAVTGTRDDREILARFDTPVVVQPGEFLQTVFKNQGVVTSAGVITFQVMFDSYWE